MFRSAEALENAHKTRVVVLDKTGTLTTGKPHITDIVTVGNTDETELLRLLYSLEKSSEHPLAEAIISEAEREIWKHINYLISKIFRVLEFPELSVIKNILREISG